MIIGTTLVITGTSGNDTIEVYQTNGLNNDVISVKENGGTPSHFLDNQFTQLKVSAGGGNDVIQFGSTALGNLSGDEPVEFAALVYGEAGNDSVDATDQGDTVYGGDGDDTVNGWDANDVVYGGYGYDVLDGGNGNDTMFGGGGGGVNNDSLSWDTLLGQAGDDSLMGEGGNDTINGGFGSDYMHGGDGNDSFAPSNEGDPDTIDGGAGTDTGTFGAEDVTFNFP